MQKRFDNVDNDFQISPSSPMMSQMPSRLDWCTDKCLLTCNCMHFSM